MISMQNRPENRPPFTKQGSNMMFNPAQRAKEITGKP
jgi:hypothetical protein